MASRATMGASPNSGVTAHSWPPYKAQSQHSKKIDQAASNAHYCHVMRGVVSGVAFIAVLGALGLQSQRIEQIGKSQYAPLFAILVAFVQGAAAWSTMRIGQPFWPKDGFPTNVPFIYQPGKTDKLD